MQIPRFAFEKFPGAKAELTTQMKSVGEAMAIGRTFQESFQKVHPRAHACGVSLCCRGSLLMSVTPNDEAERLSKIAREHALFVTQTAAVHLSQGQQCIAKLAAQTARQCILSSSAQQLDLVLAWRCA